MAVTVGDICKIILAVLLPPLGVFAEKERCDKDVLINILLTLLGYIPGRMDRSCSNIANLALVWGLHRRALLRRRLYYFKF